MNKQKKKKLITALCNNLKRDIISRIDRMPKQWDGHELRQYVGEYYTANYTGNTSLNGERKKNYENDLLINNLL